MDNMNEEERRQDFVHEFGMLHKADGDDDNDEAVEPSSTTDASTKATTAVTAEGSAVDDADAATTPLTSELTDEEIRDIEEMGIELQGHELDLHSKGFSISVALNGKAGDESGAQVRCNPNETDVDDIMSDSFHLHATAGDESNVDLKEGEKGIAVDEEEDDDDDMKELLMFKRQNSRDYMEQPPIEGLLEGIAEEPEEEGAKEIEEEYDSVVIKDDDEEDGSGSDVPNGSVKETEDEETADDQETFKKTSASVTSVVVITNAAAATATIVDVECANDIEVNAYDDTSDAKSKPLTQDISTGDSNLQTWDEDQKGKLSAAEPLAVEPMDTSTSPSSSDTTSGTDENVPAAVNGDAGEESKKKEKTEEVEGGTEGASQPKKHHDYVNIGQLGRPPSTSLSEEGEQKKAAKAEISDEDFAFEPTDGLDEALGSKASESRDASCDYVNVDTIRANKRLVSRMIQEGNDEEFERLEAEIISKLEEEEEDSDYCMPKPTSADAEAPPVTSDVREFQDGSHTPGPDATDENKNLSLSHPQDQEVTRDTLMPDEPSLKDIAKPNLSDESADESSNNEDFKDIKPSKPSTAIVGDELFRPVVKENGTAEQLEDSDRHEYKHPRSFITASSQEVTKDRRLKENLFGIDEMGKSSLKEGSSRLASPGCEISYSSRANDILPEAGCVKALVAQWQQMENKRWSRKDDMSVLNGGEQIENRGMNRSRSCGPLPRKVRVLSPDGTLDDEGRRISEWTVVGGLDEEQQQYNSQPSLTRAMLVKFERLDYETSSSAKKSPPPKKTYKWEVKEPKTLNRPSFLAH